MRPASAAEIWQEGEQINVAGGRLTKASKKACIGLISVDRDAMLRALPDSVRAYIVSAGVLCDSDFAWAWHDGELEQELKLHHIAAGEIAAAVDLWAKAWSQSLVVMAKIGTSGSSCRSSSTSTTQAAAWATMVEPKRKIRTVYLHGTASTSRASSAITNAVAVSVDEDRAHEISERTLSEIASILRAAGKTMMSPEADAGVVEEETSNILQKVLEGSDEARLRRSIRGLHRLREFAGLDPWSVSLKTLCRFFVLVSRSGPTAASGVWHQLDWSRSKFGLELPTRQPYAVAFKAAKPGKSVKQAPELQACALMKLITNARLAVGITKQFTLLVVLCAVGCIRFKHQARSKLLEMDETYLTFRCSLGKSRAGGARRPLIWIIRRCLRPGEDTFGPLSELLSLSAAESERPGFLIPDIKMRPNGRTGVFDEEARWVTDKPLPYGKFVGLTQGLLLSMGMERKEVLGVTYNTLRRSPPSIGEAAGFATEELQSLSNRSEVVKGANTEGKVLRASHPTSRTYAAGKLHTAAINRHKAVILVHMAAVALNLRLVDVTWDRCHGSAYDSFGAKWKGQSS